MRCIHLAIAGCLLTGFAAASPADDPPKVAAKVAPRTLTGSSCSLVTTTWPSGPRPKRTWKRSATRPSPNSRTRSNPRKTRKSAKQRRCCSRNST